MKTYFKNLFIASQILFVMMAFTAARLGHAVGEDFAGQSVDFENGNLLIDGKNMGPSTDFMGKKIIANRYMAVGDWFPDDAKYYFPFALSGTELPGFWRAYNGPGGAQNSARDCRAALDHIGYTKNSIDWAMKDINAQKKFFSYLFARTSGWAANAPAAQFAIAHVPVADRVGLATWEQIFKAAIPAFIKSLADEHSEPAGTAAISKLGEALHTNLPTYKAWVLQVMQDGAEFFNGLTGTATGKTFGEMTKQNDLNFMNSTKLLGLLNNNEKLADLAVELRAWLNNQMHTNSLFHGTGRTLSAAQPGSALKYELNTPEYVVLNRKLDSNDIIIKVQCSE